MWNISDYKRFGIKHHIKEMLNKTHRKIFQSYELSNRQLKLIKAGTGQTWVRSEKHRY